jgi:hypothetical protein
VLQILIYRIGRLVDHWIMQSVGIVSGICRLTGDKLYFYCSVSQRLWAELGVESPQQLADKLRQGLSTSPSSSSTVSTSNETAGPSSPRLPSVSDLNISLPTVRCKRLKVWMEDGQYRWTSSYSPQLPQLSSVQARLKIEEEIVSPSSKSSKSGSEPLNSRPASCELSFSLLSSSELCSSGLSQLVSDQTGHETVSCSRENLISSKKRPAFRSRHPKVKFTVLPSASSSNTVRENDLYISSKTAAKLNSLPVSSPQKEVILQTLNSINQLLLCCNCKFKILLSKTLMCRYKSLAGVPNIVMVPVPC